MGWSCPENGQKRMCKNRIAMDPRRQKISRKAKDDMEKNDVERRREDGLPVMGSDGKCCKGQNLLAKPGERPYSSANGEKDISQVSQ